MAVYFLNLKTFGRSGGSSAVSAAAYRAGERLRDERTGKTYDHSGRLDVMHKEILVPAGFEGSAPDWVRDRYSLWNAAESAEVRSNARVAREYLVALPAELQPDQRLDLVRGFSRELTDRYGFALDLTVHAPRDYPGSDPRNFHAHLLATTREVTAEGLGTKTSLEWNDAKRQERGLPPAIHELLFVRERWAAVTNAALRDAHIEARVDHRSLAAQGIDREPYPHIPRAAYEMERHGYRSAQAERLRAEYHARVQARLERAPERELPRDQAGAAVAGGAVAGGAAGGAVRDMPGHTTRDTPPEAVRDVPGGAAGNAAAGPARDARPPTLEDIRRQAREDWLKLRREAGAQIGMRAGAQLGTQTGARADVAAPAQRPGASHTRDDDDHLSR